MPAQRIGGYQPRDAGDQFVDVDGLRLHGALACQVAQSVDDFAGRGDGLLYVGEDGTNLASGASRPVRHVRNGRFGVGRDGCQWLLDFVNDGSCQLTDQCKSGGMGQFEPCQCQLSLSLLEVGDVAAGAQHRAAVNRYTLEMYEDVPALAVIGGDFG